MKVTSPIGMIANRLRRAEVYSKADYWDSKAEELDGHSISMWPNNHLNELYHAEQSAMIDRLLPDIRGLRALDVGCGTGRMTRYIASRGARAHGIDFAARVVDIAKRASTGDNPTYAVQSIFDIEAREQYDLVLSWGSITVAARNADELGDALRRLARALRPGGQIAMLEPIHRGFLHRVLDMNIDEFTGHMEENGFAVRQVVNMHFWPARLALAYFRVPRTITRSVYRVGQEIMTRALPHFGDYKAIHAVRR